MARRATSRANWLIEWKKCFSIVLLRFDRGSREAFHSHAFNAWSWMFPRGSLLEEVKLCETSTCIEQHWLRPSWKPIYTPRDRFHRVFGMADRTWVLSFRGPWLARWREWFPKKDKFVTLTHGRQIVAA